MSDTMHYSLRWEQHASNLVSEAECFFQDEAFLDCTLSAEGQSLQAHRLILSAASPYLASLLRVAGDKQPILIFNEMPFQVLKAIVAFIYNGQVDVPEPAVQPFLYAAKTLLLRGLSQVAATVKPSIGHPPPLLKTGRRGVLGKRPAPPLPPGPPPVLPDTSLRLQEVSASKIPTPNRTGENDQFIVRNWRLLGGPPDATNGKPPVAPLQPPGFMFKKFRLEKPPIEEVPQESPTSAKKSRDRPSPLADDLLEPTVVVKQEVEGEEGMEMVVEPKIEVEEEEDTNFPDPSQSHGVPVPLLVCKTSLQEDEGSWPDSDMSWQQQSEAEELPCNTCHKKYRSRYALNRHVLYECGKARKSFSCDECGKKVTRQDTLQKHKLIHLVQHMKEKETADT